MAKRKRKPIVNFKSYTILDFIDMLRNVVIFMTGNINFTTPSPTLASITTKVDALAAAELKAKKGDPADTQTMYDLRDDLENDAEMLGLYIYITSNGDEAKMLTSAFPLTSEDVAPATHPIFWLTQGANPGEVNANCKAIMRAGAYVWMFYIGANEPLLDADWKFFDGSTQARILFTGMPSNAKLWARAKGIIPERTEPWLTAQHIMVP